LLRLAFISTADATADTAHQSVYQHFFASYQVAKGSPVPPQVADDMESVIDRDLSIFCDVGL